MITASLFSSINYSEGFSSFDIPLMTEFELSLRLPAVLKLRNDMMTRMNDPESEFKMNTARQRNWHIQISFYFRQTL